MVGLPLEVVAIIIILILYPIADKLHIHYTAIQFYSILLRLCVAPFEGDA